MMPLTMLWLPIAIATVLVFLASWVTHMLLPFHRSDYATLPQEDDIRAALRKAGVGPGNYHFPHCSKPSEMGSPEFIQKCKEGPIGLMNIFPSGPPAMGKYLAQWFLYVLVAVFFVAYLASRTLGMMDVEYLEVFRVVGTAAFLVFALGEPVNSIWRGAKWSTTFKNIVDGSIYALLVAGTFGWLWPSR